MPGYSFNASAIGLGAVLRTGNVRTTIPSLASVALAPTGGEGSSVVENYNNCGISFSRAETRVFGTELTRGVYTTYSDVYLTNLSIRDRLRVALMGATITSTHDTNSQEARFEVKTMYRGIVIGDCEVIPEYDFELSNAPTYRHVREIVERNAERLAEQLGRPVEALRNAVADENPVEPLSGSLLRDVQVPEEVATKICGHVIEVPEVGIVHFAEFLYKPGRRRLNLLRIELGRGRNGGNGGSNRFALMAGNEEEGDLTGGSVEGNGTPPTGG